MRMIQYFDPLETLVMFYDALTAYVVGCVVVLLIIAVLAEIMRSDDDR